MPPETSTRTARLEAMNTELSALSIPEQVAKIGELPLAELADVLSDDAPDGIIKRFANRIHEVLKLGKLSAYEIGRVEFLRGNLVEAEARYQRAINAKDKRGHLGMGQILISQTTENAGPNHSEALKHLAKARKAGVKPEATWLYTGMALAEMKKPQEAEEAFEKSIANSTQPEVTAQFIEALKLLISTDQPALEPDGKKEIEKKADGILKSLASKGHMWSIILLTTLATLDNSEEAEETLIFAATHGETRALINLGQIYVKKGDLEKAAKMFKLSYDAGYTGILTTLCNLLLAIGDVAAAEAYALKAIAKEDPNGYLAISKVVLAKGDPNDIVDLQHRSKEAERFLHLGIQKGAELPIEIALKHLLANKQYNQIQKICTEHLGSDHRMHFYLALSFYAQGKKVLADKQMEEFCKKSGKPGEYEQVLSTIPANATLEETQPLQEFMAVACHKIGLTPDELGNFLIPWIFRKVTSDARKK